MQDADPVQNNSAGMSLINDDEARVRLRWQDVVTKELRAPLLKTPITLGRDFANMPSKLNGRRLSKVVFESNMVSRYHALIDWVDNQLVIIDQDSANGTYVNGQLTSQSPLQTGDSVKIGPYVVTIRLEAVPQVVADVRDTVLSLHKDSSEEELPDLSADNTKFHAHPDFQPEVNAVFDLAQGYQALKHDIQDIEERLQVMDRLYKHSSTFLEEQEQILDLKFTQLDEKIAQLNRHSSQISAQIIDGQEFDLTDQQKEMFKKMLNLVGMQIDDLQDLVESRYQKHDTMIRELRFEVQNTSRISFLGGAFLLLALLTTWFFMLSH